MPFNILLKLKDADITFIFKEKKTIHPLTRKHLSHFIKNAWIIPLHIYHYTTYTTIAYIYIYIYISIYISIYIYIYIYINFHVC